MNEELAARPDPPTFLRLSGRDWVVTAIMGVAHFGLRLLLGTGLLDAAIYTAVLLATVTVILAFSSSTRHQRRRDSRSSGQTPNERR